MKKNRVEIIDPFWGERIKYMCETIIPYQYEVLNDQVEGLPASHAIENFRIAAGLSQEKYQGMLFQDSDVGKWIEAAAYSLTVEDNPKLEEKIDGIVSLLRQAQAEDGYLNSYYTCVRSDEKLTNIAHGHEMYCTGHLIEAAVAYARVSGKTEMLDIMERCVKWFMDRIGPEDGKRHIYPGHPELELALYKLYQYTGNEKYLDFMEYLLLERGKQPSFLLEDPGFGEQYRDKWFGLSYHQAHIPLMEQTEAKGHAVRAMYLYAGLADLAYERKEPEIISILDALWKDVTEKKMYITGAIGSEEHGESFGVPYDLPNDRGYGETCAAVGLIFWAKRMLKLRRDRKYADIMELALYNGALSGMSSDGTKYFYTNPLMLIPEQAETRYDLRHIRTRRAGWFGCACCPPNIARLTASLSEYICDCSPEREELTIHLYIGGRIYINKDSCFCARGDYLNSGKMTYQYEGAPGDITLRMRIPGWSRKTEIRLNGRPYKAEYEHGYAIIKRRWTDREEIEMVFDISPRMIYADPRIAADAGRVAVKRGPLVYCLEEADNGRDLNAITVKSFCAKEEWEKESTRFGSAGYVPPVQPVYLRGSRETADLWKGRLYSDCPPEKKTCVFAAVPYFLWGNRGTGEMLVWIRKE